MGHLSAELLSSMAKIKMVHVAYKGTGQSITDLIAGHVQLQFSSMPAVINHARAGKLRLLAQTGEKRSGAQNLAVRPAPGQQTARPPQFQ